MSSAPPAEGEGQSDIGAAAAVAASAATNEVSDSPDGASLVIPWKDRLDASIALTRKIRGSNYVQLSTVDLATNEPRNRCVVFRGFQKLPSGHPLAQPANAGSGGGNSMILKMCTHLRSKKVGEGKVAELVWWFPKTSEQYRVRGDLVYVGGGGGKKFEHDGDRDLQIARKELWGNLSDPARESFLVEGAVPGEEFSEDAEDACKASPPPAGGRDSEGKVVPVPDNFLLLLLVPRHVDYLCLSNMYRQEDEILAGGGSDNASTWSMRRLNP